MTEPVQQGMNWPLIAVVALLSFLSGVLFILVVNKP